MSPSRRAQSSTGRLDVTGGGGRPFLSTHEDVGEFVAGRCRQFGQEEIVNEQQLDGFELGAEDPELAQLAGFGDVELSHISLRGQVTPPAPPSFYLWPTTPLPSAASCRGPSRLNQNAAGRGILPAPVFARWFSHPPSCR